MSTVKILNGSTVLARLLMGALASVLAGSSAAQDFRDDFTAVTPSNFDSGGRISRQFHLNAESYLRMATIARRTDVRDLPVEPNQRLAEWPVSHDGVATSLAGYVAKNPLIDGLVIVHDGKIVFETYPNMHGWQRHFAWSVTKVVTSTALAVLFERGDVDMDKPVEFYVPVLKGSAWSGISVQQVADMASGIDCLDSDGYQDPATCVYTMEESLDITAATGREPDFIEHLQGMARRGPAGARNEYVSANTNVLMLVIEAATGKPFATALQDLLWNRVGAEADALIAISEAGYAYASGGLHARLRDVARFGQIYAQPEVDRVLAPSTIGAIQAGGIALSPEQLEVYAKLLGEDLPVRSGWQWDAIWSDGAMYKAGYSGQGLYVDPARNLVVAWFGTGLDFGERISRMFELSRQIARSGFFDREPR